jgi:two-component system, LytTR family, response regulator
MVRRESAAITVVIADDEPVARAGLREMLSDIEWIHVIGEADNGPAAVETIERLRPDLVLLDIQMPGLLGTDVLRRLTHRPFVVFTTAHGEHAATAFELGALDYLLKPFGPARLGKALERMNSRCDRRAALRPAGPGSSQGGDCRGSDDAPLRSLRRRGDPRPRGQRQLV